VLRVLTYALTPDASDDELGQLDACARAILTKIFPSKALAFSHFVRRLGVSGEDLQLPVTDADHDTYVPITDVVSGERRERFGRTFLGRQLVDVIVTALQGCTARQAVTPPWRLTAKAFAEWFVGRGALPTKRSKATADAFARGAEHQDFFLSTVSPPPAQWLRLFLLDHGVQAEPEALSLESGFRSVFGAHRIDTKEQQVAAACALLRAALRVAGLTKHQARSLLEADERASRRGRPKGRAA
jgi:hypothetical protein